MDQTFGHVLFNSALGTSTTPVVMGANLTTLGDLTLATTREQLAELDAFIEDLSSEMPMWGPDAPRKPG